MSILLIIISYRIVSYRIVSYRIVSYRIVSYRIVSYRIVSYRIVSYRIVLGYCIVLRNVWCIDAVRTKMTVFRKWYDELADNGYHLSHGCYSNNLCYSSQNTLHVVFSSGFQCYVKSNSYHQCCMWQKHGQQGNHRWHTLARYNHMWHFICFHHYARLTLWRTFMA